MIVKKFLKDSGSDCAKTSSSDIFVTSISDLVPGLAQERLILNISTRFSNLAKG